jgi:importin subunit alpha-1
MGLEDRKCEFKKGISLDGRARRRNETSINLRKQKKEESLNKRRNMAVPQQNNFMGDMVCGAEASPQSKELPNLQTLINAGLSEIYAHMISMNPEKQLLGTTAIRKILSKETNPPVDDVLKCGAMPLLIQFLGRDDMESLQIEAAWALTNIASTECTKIVVEGGALPQLIRLLMSGNSDIREQCAWCIGNIAGDCTDLRDMVLQYGALNPILANLQNPANPGLLKNVTWALSNLCRGSPAPNRDMIRPAVPVLKNLITHAEKEVVTDACWALSYITNGENERIQEVVDPQTCLNLVKLIQDPSATIITPALRTLGNFATGTHEQTQAVIDAGALKYFVKLTEHSKKNIKKEACWALSNIAAGTPSQIEQLLATPMVLHAMITQASKGEWAIKKEATWTLSNIATTADAKKISMLVEAGGMSTLCSMLQCSDSTMTMVALEAFEGIFKAGAQISGEGENVYTQMAEELGISDIIEQLQEHDNESVYQKALEIIENFFGVTDEDENLAPNEIDGQFSFGMQAKPMNMDFGGFGQQATHTYFNSN